jgi:hypothetical protein
VQSPSSIDNHDVEAAQAGIGDGPGRPRDRIHAPRGIVDGSARLPTDDAQLLDGRRTPDVGRDEQRVTPLLLEPHRELAGGRRLAGPLESEQQYDPRRGRRRRQAAGRLAEQRQHLVPDNANHLLSGSQAAKHLLVDGAVAHPVDEGLDDLEVDVGLEQRQPDLPQGGFDGLLRETHLTPEAAKHVLEARTERIEHDGTGAGSSRSAAG